MFVFSPFFLLINRRPPRPTLFPYTTLFRSEPFLQVRLPEGLGQQIEPTVSGDQRATGIILNSHWMNGSNAPQRAAVKIKLMAAPKHSVRQYVLPLFDVVANGFIDVPPGQKTSVHW